MKRFQAVWLMAGTASIAFAVPANAADDETLVLDPSSSWQIDYGNDRCRLARVFGEGRTKTIFWMEQTGPDSTFSWMVAGGAVNRLGLRRGISAQFGPEFAPIEVSRETPSRRLNEDIELKGYGNAIQYLGYKPFPPATEVSETAAETSESATPRASISYLDPADGAKISYVEFSRGNRRVRLDTGTLDAGFTALNSCAKDLYEFWGVDPASLTRFTEAAKPLNMQEVAKQVQRRYPRAAEWRGEEAMLQLKVLVGTDGRVEKCVTIKQIATENFEDQACQVFSELARFDPAKNGAGNAVRSFYSVRVAYIMN